MGDIVEKLRKLQSDEKERQKLEREKYKYTSKPDGTIDVDKAVFTGTTTFRLYYTLTFS